MKTQSRIRNIDEFFSRWPTTALESGINADVCSVIEAQERREAERYTEGSSTGEIAWGFALAEFMTGHAFAARCCILSGRVV